MKNEKLRRCRSCGKEFDDTEILVGPYCSMCDHLKGNTYNDAVRELGLKKASG